jgi:hypothetical protein
MNQRIECEKIRRNVDERDLGHGDLKVARRGDHLPFVNECPLRLLILLKLHDVEMLISAFWKVGLWPATHFSIMTRVALTFVDCYCEPRSVYSLADSRGQML